MTTLLLCKLVGHAQVANDDLENRRLLRAEETVTSSTVGCTVQRGCVDERLTGKCIEYHNDQWFEFTPTASGTYYANVGGQRCRDLRGVQLVVLTGTPCQPATYRVLSCTSLGTQDDLFVVLPDLRAGQPYLLDVDGYLEDYCRFTLQVSGRARGLPAGPAAGAAPTAQRTTSRVVRIAWQVPDSLAAASYCRVLRREQHQFRAQEIGRVSITRDTYGRHRADYFLPDTLAAAGQYLYQVVADYDPADPAARPPALLSQRWVAYGTAQASGAAAEANFLLLPLERYPLNAQLTVLVTNPETGKLLRKLPLLNQPRQPNRGRLYAQDWVNAGLDKVAVAITCYPPGGAPYTDHLLLPLGPTRPAVPLLKNN